MIHTLRANTFNPAHEAPPTVEAAREYMAKMSDTLADWRAEETRLEKKTEKYCTRDDLFEEEQSIPLALLLRRQWLDLLL